MNMNSPRLLICFATLSLAACVGLAAEKEKPAPDKMVLEFLGWYLPAAFEKGADVLLDKRMDAYMDAKTLAAWRKSHETEHGFGAVPFVGQDYADEWATNFKVTQVEQKGATAKVDVSYVAPEWTNHLRIILVRTESGWRIKDYEHL